MRLIDAESLLHEVGNYNLQVCVYKSDGRLEIMTKVTQAVQDHTAKCIADAPTIDPETLPIVRQLREKLMLTEANQQHFKEERDEFEFKMREVAEAANAEIDRRNKTIAELREENEKLKHAFGDTFACDLMDKLDKAEKELARVTAERDAAVSFIPKTCTTCKYGESPCDWRKTDPDGDLNWEWNGKRKEARP